ncbi:MAG: hypothetical protein IKH44_02025 [Bacteroidales bacterium]|nr:hypothetical protein [Bacteroidales bacterium]
MTEQELVDGSSEADIDTKALDEYFNKVFGKRVDEFNGGIARTCPERIGASGPSKASSH